MGSTKATQKGQRSGEDVALAIAARALARFEPLVALGQVALRRDPAALVLRGVALAQLGEYAPAQKLLARAARSFERSEPQRRARCLAAMGEIALAQRDLDAAGRALDAAATALDACGDATNASFVRVQLVRRLVLLGRVQAAGAALASVDLRGAPARLRALAALVRVDIEARALHPQEARASLAYARRAAGEASIGALSEEIERAGRDLDAPVARIVQGGVERPAILDEVARLFRTRDVIVDACRREVRAGEIVIPLVSRPVLLALAVALGTAAPNEATREELCEKSFGVRRVSESSRARLRVEVGRLRTALKPLATISPTPGGYVVVPRRARSVAVLVPPVPGEASAILALLRSGESWTTSALAASIGSAQRTVQRALVLLREEGRVEATGGGRSQRWVARPPEGFATNLLLATRPLSE